ncbi:hypothetical protein SFRURICE_018675 [Spodoptera frugiperda]|nr:hypothetical protein SFRURICE_018675 [Spodoptera frugiperda]
MFVKARMGHRFKKYILVSLEDFKTELQLNDILDKKNLILGTAIVQKTNKAVKHFIHYAIEKHSSQ